MSRTTLFLTLMLILGQVSHADTSTTMITINETKQMSLSEIISYGLPVLYVETVNSEEPTCDYVSAPPGCMSASIANATKVPGRLMIYSRVDELDSVLYDSGDYEKNVSGMTIKLRGNKTAYDVKKPYKIKLQKKHDLLFRGVDSVYKDKEWLLLRDDFLSTIAGLRVNEVVGMTWTPRHHFVNLVMNGRYRGTYLLCEAIKRNPDCRLNVDKQTGFIFECDPYWWNENVYVTSSTAPKYNFTFKYPDEEDLTEEKLTYMQDLVTRYERSLSTTDYPDLIDVKSFAGWCLVHDIMGTNDAGGGNRFYIKYDTTDASRIVMPLAWDFDMAERTTSAWSASHIDHMTVLFNNSNRTFVSEYAALWRKVKDRLSRDVCGYMTAFRTSPEGVALNNSLNLDNLVYGRLVPVNTCVAGTNYWINNRQTWLDNSINAMNPIGDVNVDGVVDISDAIVLINLILNDDESNAYSSDVNQDGDATISDVMVLINILLS